MEARETGRRRGKEMKKENKTKIVGSTFLGRIGGPLRMEAWRWNLNAHEK
jgi:hypothetical protein